MKSEVHQRAFLVFKLLQKAGYSDFDYDAFGKPHLHDGKFIFITIRIIFRP
jgi:hypothetical protein